MQACYNSRVIFDDEGGHLRLFELDNTHMTVCESYIINVPLRSVCRTIQDWTSFLVLFSMITMRMPRGIYVICIDESNSPSHIFWWDKNLQFLLL